MSMKWTTNCSHAAAVTVLAHSGYAEGTPNPPAAVSNSISIAFGREIDSVIRAAKKDADRFIFKARESLAADERDADES